MSTGPHDADALFAQLPVYAVESVKSLTKSQVRVGFAGMREAARTAPDDFWNLLIPDIGLTVGEFAMGYVLTRRL